MVKAKTLAFSAFRHGIELKWYLVFFLIQFLTEVGIAIQKFKPTIDKIIPNQTLQKILSSISIRHMYCLMMIQFMFPLHEQTVKINACLHYFPYLLLVSLYVFMQIGGKGKKTKTN
jgi:hypothetical protein